MSGQQGHHLFLDFEYWHAIFPGAEFVTRICTSIQTVFSVWRWRTGDTCLCDCYPRDFGIIQQHCVYLRVAVQDTLKCVHGEYAVYRMFSAMIIAATGSPYDSGRPNDSTPITTPALVHMSVGCVSHLLPGSVNYSVSPP